MPKRPIVTEKRREVTEVRNMRQTAPTMRRIPQMDPTTLAFDGPTRDPITLNDGSRMNSTVKGP